jgi:tetratricopeptide (TPR) repeat protein
LVAALTLVIVAILWSLSRGGAIVLLVAATVLIAICLHRRIVDSRYAYGLMSLAIVVLGFLSLYGYEELAGRLDDFSEVTLDAMDHAGGRRTIWAANIAAIQAGWLVGAGAGSHSEITPVYLPESLTQEYTHAENGYLQVVTETGIFGAALAGLGIGVCGYWCYVCLRHTTKAEEVVCFVACAAGLATSAVHSAFDFVWYVPACMSVTVILAACTFRLAQAARPGAVDSSATPPSWSRVLSRSRWLELAAAVVLLGVWMIHTYFGPGMAAIHWDRYLRASVADGELSRQLLNRFISGEGTGSAEMRRSLSQIMLEELEQAVAWDSRFARAHARLADRMMAEFELRAADSANAMDVPQIRNAAEASEFASLQELRNWLAKAFGEDAELLPHALEHAHRAVSLCPLRGDSYLYLADLAFLEGASRSMVRAYIAQGLRVRPNDRKVLFRAGRQELLLGEPEAAIVHWSKCFNTPGIHQGQIVYGLVSSGMPATEFVARFNPDWYSLREIWNHYRDRGTKRDLDVLLHYAAQMTRQSIDPNDSLRPESVWYWLASMYADVGRAADSLACLERAYMCDSRQFHIRYALGKALLNAGRHREAEPHVRWCLARRPAEESLDAALATIARKRYAERSQTESRVRQVSATLVR